MLEVEVAQAADGAEKVDVGMEVEVVEKVDVPAPVAPLAAEVAPAAVAEVAPVVHQEAVVEVPAEHEEAVAALLVPMAAVAEEEGLKVLVEILAAQTALLPV